jgi:hypothetical protein
MMDETISYMTSQTSTTKVLYQGKMKPMSELPWGSAGNLAENGCGIIAAYNILASRGIARDFEMVYDDLQEMGAALLGGKLGANPFVLKKYLEKHCGVSGHEGPFSLSSLYPQDDTLVEQWIRTALSKVSSNSQPLTANTLAFRRAHSVLLLFKWEGSMLMHYFAGTEGTNGVYRFWNTGLRDAKAHSLDGQGFEIISFLKQMAQDGHTLLYLLSFENKK